MATALQQQLAAISAKSTDQLNLKAQKQRHAKSLLFEPREAAGQSFDTLYQICYEGFDDLCQLDGRFRVFERNLFAPTSLEVEREHLSAKENTELDAVIEQFFGLVCGRLLLRPAQKSVEWLVRRWKAHEHNTAVLLLAFLPYHGHDIFPTVLSILPQQIPPIFSFLRPYVAALQSPPRHALVAAAVNNLAFTTDLSNFVLKSARRRHHSGALIGFWASITAQAVNGLLDNAQSGRPAVRQQRIEDVLFRVLPLLQDALSIKGVSELYMASCMIMTILATKAQLDDRVLDAMMEAIAGAWTSETLEDGLLCLAVLAEDKSSLEQSKAVTDKIYRTDKAMSTIGKLSERHLTGKLALATLFGGIAGKAGAEDTLLKLCDVIATEQQHLRFLCSELVRNLTDESAPELPKGSQRALLQHLAAKSHLVSHVESAVQGTGHTLEKLGITPNATPQIAQVQVDEPEPEEDVDEMEVDLDSVLRELPSLPSEQVSFVGSNNQTARNSYVEAFNVAVRAQDQSARLVQLPSLHADKSASRPELLTLLAAVWTTSGLASTRSKALGIASKNISQWHTKQSKVDCQSLLPFVISALADSNKSVRQAASKLAMTIATPGKESGKSTDGEIWCKTSIYGNDSDRLQLLSTQEAAKFMASAILPVLEDCMLDPTCVTRYIAEQLNGSDLKASLRSNACAFLASHAASSGISQISLTLLNVLAHVGKTASQARIKVVVPFVGQLLSSESSAESSLVAQAALRCLSHRTTEEIECLQHVAQAGSPDMAIWSLHRLADVFKSMKTQAQSSTAGFLLDQSARAATNGDSPDESRISGSLDSLRALPLPGDVLAYLLDNVPSVTSLQDQERPAKRQRTSKSTPEKAKPIDMAKANAALRKLIIVLELVESITARPRVDPLPQLLKGLFNVLSELHRWRAMIDSDLVYVQSLLLGDLLGVVNSLDAPTASNVDRSVIRTDLIVEALRSTSSPQVHNTALLLISKLATLVPDTVLHSVMPLFTFMSSNTLRQADQYSSHVVNMTVESIVPPLAASLRKRGRDLVAGAAELLLSFTAAFEHMPLHRRLNTFQHLVQTLGPGEVLFAVIAMLVERYQDNNTLPAFVRELCNGCTVGTQLTATVQYLDLVVDACKTKRPLADSILGFNEKNADQIQSSVANLLEGLPMLLDNSALKKGLAAEMQQGAEQSEKLRTIYGQLLERIVSLPRLSLPKGSVSLQEPKILAANDRVLQALLGLMPTEDFITSSASLMQTGSEQVRTRVFASLTERVNAAKQGNTALRTVFIDALPNCTAFLVPSQPVAVRHAALNCIDGICEKYGKLDRAACSEAAEAVTGSAALKSDNQILRVAAMLCLASMVENLGEEMLGLAPKVMDFSLDFVESPTGCTNETRDAVFSLLNALLDTVPFVLSATYLDRAIVAAAKCSEAGTKQPFVLQQFASLTSKKVAFHELMGSLDRTWETLSHHSAHSVGLSVELLQQAIKMHTKAVVTRHAAVLFSVVLKAFDLRRLLLASASENEVPERVIQTTSLVTQTALDMTLKLNDTTFRPFFIRLVAWVSDELPTNDTTGRASRGVALYAFASRLFDQLGAIVTSYASFLLDHAVRVLQTPQAPAEGETGVQLALVLQTLQAAFVIDQDDFWAAPQHFSAIAGPLVDNLARAPAAPDGAIVNTIAELAASVTGSEHLKTLNGLIMHHLRRGEAGARLEAVRCERAVTKRLTFDWLAMLPEMLPAISEVLEDDDEGVEREAVTWVREVEEVTGESLEGMLA